MGEFGSFLKGIGEPHRGTERFTVIPGGHIVLRRDHHINNHWHPRGYENHRYPFRTPIELTDDFTPEPVETGAIAGPREEGLVGTASVQATEPEITPPPTVVETRVVKTLFDARTSL